MTVADDHQASLAFSDAGAAATVASSQAQPGRSAIGSAADAVAAPTWAAASDAALLAAVANRDEHALVALYDRHGGPAYALAHRVLGGRDAAENVVRATFLAVWHRTATVHAGHRNVRLWLLALVRLRAVDQLRGTCVQQATPHDGVATMRRDGDLAQATNAPSQAKVVGRVLAALADAPREALLLAYFGGLTCREIADRTGVQDETVRGHLRHGMNMLRNALGQPKEAQLPATASPPGRTRAAILIVEDDPGIREMTRDALRDAGFRVVAATNHVDGLTALTALRFSLILIDTAGGPMVASDDRWTDLDRLRAAAGDAPTVIFTAHNPAAFDGYAERGFAGVIAKPFDRDTLLATVHGHLA